jgi:hypothetical protein
MLTIPYSVKLLSSLLCTESFRNTRNCSKPWSTQKGHSFSWRSSGVQKSTTFPQGTEHLQSALHKAVSQSEFKAWTHILKISELKIEQEKSQTHTHTHTYTHAKCWYTVHYLVSKFLNSIYWITRLNHEMSLNPRIAWWTPSIPTIQMRGFLSGILMYT